MNHTSSPDAWQAAVEHYLAGETNADTLHRLLDHTALCAQGRQEITDALRFAAGLAATRTDPSDHARETLLKAIAQADVSANLSDLISTRPMSERAASVPTLFDTPPDQGIASQEPNDDAEFIALDAALHRVLQATQPPQGAQARMQQCLEEVDMPGSLDLDEPNQPIPFPTSGSALHEPWLLAAESPEDHEPENPGQTPPPASPPSA